MVEAKKRGRKNFIIPLAGGKGGTGKTLLVANLGLALARRELAALVVDLDLGASNLHTLLGLKNVKDGVGRLMVTKGMRLEEVVHQTPFPGLSYIPGETRSSSRPTPTMPRRKRS